jgi:hypothetical protein
MVIPPNVYKEKLEKIINAMIALKQYKTCKNVSRTLFVRHGVCMLLVNKKMHSHHVRVSDCKHTTFCEVDYASVAGVCAIVAVRGLFEMTK